MSSKSSRKTQSVLAGTSSRLGEEVERLIQKERFKDAVKQAKLCYKEENTPENHRLLERAYFLRARQLVQLGMPDSAREVSQHLLDFGVTASDWVDEFVRLLMGLGLGQNAFHVQEKLGTPDLKDQLVRMAADQAVIHPEKAGEIAPGLARDATLIRQSLEQLQANDEAGALMLLRDLARSSPLSEWKYFVRGMAAYNRHEAAEIQVNWDRLDPARKAFGIAQRLRSLAQAEESTTDDPNLEAMETLAFGEPVLARLRQVRSHAANQEWEKLIRLLGPLRQSLRRIEPKLAERLTRILFGSVIEEATNLDLISAKRLLTGFTLAAEPLAIDPAWNRLWAIAWDGPQAATAASLDHWVRYLEDLKTIPAFNPTERALAQAMVWNHIALLHRDVVADLTDPGGSDFRFFALVRPKIDDRAVDRAKKKVIECLEKSLELAPAHLPTYRLLIAVYRGWDDAAGLEAAVRRLLAKFPEDLESLSLLARKYLDRNDTAAAMPIVQKARALRPLDESLRELEWTVRVGLARNHALVERWDEGREQFRAAEELLPECRRQYWYLARKVIFEAKASQPGQSDVYLREAQALLAEPTPLWLALLIESIRYGMTASHQKGYAELWAAELKKKCRSETAGEMAALLDSYTLAGVEYPGRAGHIKQFLAFVERTTRLKYRREDIERVCEFLVHRQDQARLLDKLLKSGLKHHPESPLLNLRAGLIGMANETPKSRGEKARSYLQKALALAEASTVPKETALLKEIKAALTMLNEVSERRFRHFGFDDGPFPFPIPGEGDEFDEFFDDDFDEDENEWDDDDDGFGWRPVSIPSPPPRAKKHKSRKKR